MIFPKNSSPKIFPSSQQHYHPLTYLDMSSATLTRFTSALLLVSYGFAFVVPSNSIGSNVWGGMKTSPQYKTVESTSLFAQKKRRRRKEEDSSSSTPSNPDPAQQFDDEEDELPDFDLVEDIDLKERAEARSMLSSSKKGAKGAAAAGDASFDVNAPKVLAAMRATKGTGSTGAASTKELLRSRNRALEEKLVINPISEYVPSLAEYTQGKGAPTGGKKAARREARVAAAMENEPVEEEESFLDTLLEKLPFFKKKEEEKVEKTPIKVRPCNRFKKSQLMEDSCYANLSLS